MKAFIAAVICAAAIGVGGPMSSIRNRRRSTSHFRQAARASAIPDTI